MTDSLAEILAENRITLRKGIPDPGRSVKVICPECNGGKHSEISLSVTADDDGAGFVWRCHRGTCGWVGSGRISGRQSPHAKQRVFRKPEPLMEEQPDWLYTWWAKRGISADAVDRFGVHANKGAIVFPYVWQGVVRNRKFRGQGDDKRMWQEENPEPTLFGIDQLGDAPQTVGFVEGEPDVLAMFDCGFPCVTLKDGAPKVGKADHELRYAALKTHADLLDRVKVFILAGDCDEPGIALRDELARRLGRHRCKFVTWPDGCKDANETLQRLGGDAVRKAWSEAEPYPIEGIQSAFDGVLVNYLKKPPTPMMGTGLAHADDHIMLPTEGRLIVITGWPGSGKSSFLRWVMIHTIAAHGRRWACFSPEMSPWEMFLSTCAEVIIGKPFHPFKEPSHPAHRPGLNEAEAAYAERWLAGRVHMITSDDLEAPPQLDWLLERVRILVARDGITDFLLDPWNEMDYMTRGGMSETDFIGRALQIIKAFCARYGVNVWIIAHPAKPPPLRGEETRKAPTAHDISGSAMWHNKPDLVLTVDSPENGVCDVVCRKSRLRWSVKGNQFRSRYDRLTGRYSALETPLGLETGMVRHQIEPALDDGL